jgi:cell division protein FtsN
MFVGVSIGVLLGLCAALGVALYLNKASPFVARQAELPKPPAKVEAPKSPPAGLPMPMRPQQDAAKPGSGTAQDSSRFEFYKILPGEDNQNLKRPQPATATKEVFYLQAGAFQKASDADNLKARLALAGLEAQIQTATLTDRSVWHRVRLGPYVNEASMNQVLTVLRENKIDARVIKQSEQQPQS